MANDEPAPTRVSAARFAFGRDVLGPILARVTRDLVLWARSSPNPADTAVLFASRGGWRMELIAQRFARQTGYGFGEVKTARLMISRLLAMRACLGTTDAAVEELARYAAGKPMAWVAALLLPPGTAIPPSPLLEQPVSPEAIRAMLSAGDALAAALREDVARQRTLLDAHLDTIRAGRTDVIFVDTGLFGSMFRILDEARPDLKTALVMLGRCFYRAPLPYQRERTFGLAFQCDRFRLSAPESAVIRHWYLFETLFEPDMASITRLEPSSTGTGPDTTAMKSPAVAAPSNPFFSGILDYVATLGPADLLTIDAKAEHAARRLAQAILAPSAADVATLGIGPSDASPGDETGMESVIPLAGASISQRLASIRKAHWQEGQAKLAFPALGALVLPALAMARIAAGAR